MGGLRGNGSVPSLPPPRPKSPPEYPDLYGKRRELAKVQMLEREISFLEEELKSVEGLQPASKSCKEVADFVTANLDPFISTTKKTRRSCSFWKWLCCGVSCFKISWICCCSCPSCPEKPHCCSNCLTCSCSNPCVGCCQLPDCRCTCSCLNSQCCFKRRCKCSRSCCNCCCDIPKCPSTCCSCPSVRCSECCCAPKCPEFNIKSCFTCKRSCRCRWRCTSCCCYPCYLCY